MNKKKVIKRSQLPVRRLPVTEVILLCMATEIWDMPGWLLGTLGTLLALFWVAVVLVIQNEEGVELEELKGE